MQVHVFVLFFTNTSDPSNAVYMNLHVYLSMTSRATSLMNPKLEAVWYTKAMWQWKLTSARKRKRFLLEKYLTSSACFRFRIKDCDNWRRFLFPKKINIRLDASETFRQNNTEACTVYNFVIINFKGAPMSLLVVFKTDFRVFELNIRDCLRVCNNWIMSVEWAKA